MGLSLLLITEEYVKVILRRHCFSICLSITNGTSTGNRSPGLMFADNLSEPLAEFEMEIEGYRSCKAKTYLWSNNIVSWRYRQ
ncbi:hypothetical protein GAYE_HTGSCF06PCTG21G0264 [Galdieria yellowstonensis]|uniref:Uncharacterized protein n=1 Tax=Galdieria yellowstonensis TaxID=3028027 RepID=A0AAV9I6A1_9RHOD|nr:hypothetical protein GAYE_HTGSCF06PCTG21G0264 [Galdieria yellowstonensis]